jgi:4-hydroxythreonine-4-phosphate dehydrogenase
MVHIGITMGCPVGIGPEIILKYFSQKYNNQHSVPVIIGDINVLERCRQELGIGKICTLWQPGDLVPIDTIPVFAVSALDDAALRWGEPTQQTGRAMADYIKSAVTLFQHGWLDGIATCPISKKALQEAGYTFPGHTEMLAHLTGESAPTMMMTGPKLRVTLVTIHCPLTAVAAQINSTSVLQVIRSTHLALSIDFNIPTPRIAVAGLNPHCGEQGRFGNEETLKIVPAIDIARQEGINAMGPYPADTVFFKAAAGDYDAVVCMYHDQGLIPFKLLHFFDGVNVTIGLSIVRTSVDHGTAYDIAGKGIANPESLAAAITLAGAIANNRRAHVARLHARQGLT